METVEEIQIEVGENPLNILKQMPCALCGHWEEMGYYVAKIVGFDSKHFVCDSCADKIDFEVYLEIQAKNKEANESVCKR